METQRQQIHAVMLPWLAQGHINPFLNLSTNLVTYGEIKLTVVSTPVNISRMKARLQGKPIDLVELALPSVDGLPPGAECTADIQPAIAHLLHAAFDQLEEPFETLLRRLSPDVVVYDVVAPWAAPVAARLEIPSLPFSVYSPAVFSYILNHVAHGWSSDKTAESLTRPAPGYPSALISWRLFEARLVWSSMANFGVRIMASCRQSCGILIKSCFEEEEKFLQLLRDITGKPVISVGPSMSPASGGAADDESGNYLLKWLDGQRPWSVVFVAFGSESFLSGEETKQVALALEETGMPFLWSLRLPQFSDAVGAPSSLSSLLPEGFEGRTKDRGLVIDGWIPQQRIVSHGSVGCYVTHGGWSSVMEAWLYQGLPMVLLPLRHDQGLNCRQIALELNAGIEVERGPEDGSFSKEDVGAAVRVVMSKEEKGAEIRSRVGQLRCILRRNTERQEAYITELVDHMRKVVATRDR